MIHVSSDLFLLVCINYITNFSDLKFSPWQKNLHKKRNRKSKRHGHHATAGVSKSSKLTSKSEEKRKDNEEAQRKAQGRGSVRGGTTLEDHPKWPNFTGYKWGITKPLILY